jgi:hypothetical protein
MRIYKKRSKTPPTLVTKSESWIKGLNQLVSPTQLKANELAEAIDIQLVEDGKVQCPRDGQAYYGATTDSRVLGLFSYYKSDGTNKLLRMSTTTLREYTDTTTWTAITGYTYTTGKNMNGAMANDRMYLVNGTDPLTYFDGTNIQSFTSRSAPTISSVVRTGGSAGTYTYSYKVKAVTDVGSTAPSAAVTATADWAEPTTSNYMTLTWGAVTGATGYEIYGRRDNFWYYMASVEGNGTVTYVDNGADTPNEAFAITDVNTTAGPTGSYISVYKDSLFIAGDPTYPSRLYYSGGGDQINNFSIDGGGGLIDISKNDGQMITGLAVFKDKLIIFKEDSIYQFSFTSTGLPQVEQVTGSIGAIAPRSIVTVENDVFFLSRRGVFTIGNEAGFAFDVLRTNELSSRVRPIVQTIDSAYIQNASATYVTSSDFNVYILSYTPSGSTTNSQALIYDRERLGWYRWTNIKANCWTKYIDSDGVVHYLYGDDSSGYVKEIFSGSDDFGSGIHGYFYLRGEAFNTGIDHYKTLKDLDMVLRTPRGSISLTIVQDGVNSIYSAPIGTVSPSINWGHYTFTDFTFADSQGAGVSASDELLLRSIKNLNLRNGKTYQMRFDNNSSASFVLLSARMTARPRGDRYRISTDLLNV